MLIVTGGVGFIGSNLVYGLNKINQNNIIICDTANSKLKKSYLKKAKYKKIIPPSNFFYFLEKNKKKIKYIFHLGAITATTSLDFKKLLKNNLELSIKILKFCTNNKIGFIYASSASTYGSGANGFNDKENYAYLNKLKPLNFYGKSKHFFDLHIKCFDNYKKYPLTFVGSVAFYLSDYINEIAKKEGMQVQEILQSPIENLVRDHFKK